eukprot:7058096-Pyramimonas_sp.AAC.1
MRPLWGRRGCPVARRGVWLRGQGIPQGRTFRARAALRAGPCHIGGSGSPRSTSPRASAWRGTSPS